MNGNNVRRIIRYITIFAAILLAVPSVAQFRPPPNTIKVIRIPATPGPPDLVVRLSYDFSGTGPTPTTGYTVKVTVINQFTFVRTPPLRYFGSDAQGVIVRISWAGQLSLVGSTIQGPAGFECFVGGNQDLLCAGGNIPAGGNALFQFDLTAPDPTGPPCAPGYNAPVQAKVDPYNSIGEADETNNEGSIDIFVFSPC
jgi:hypothetical protein